MLAFRVDLRIHFRKKMAADVAAEGVGAWADRYLLIHQSKMFGANTTRLDDSGLLSAAMH
jgi:hypothetical protein